MTTLFRALPSSIHVNDLTIELETGASTWIELYGENPKSIFFPVKAVLRDGKPVHLNSLTQEEVKAVFDRLVWFCTGGQDKDEKQESRASKERLLDYMQDFNFIRSALLQANNINLIATDSEG